MLDVVIIGSGPAGITAAIYAKRANLNVAVVEKEYLGTGQIAESSRVDNYPGIPGIDGYSLGEKFREHAESLGVEFTEAQVLSLGQKDGIWIIGCDEDITLESKAVIYATGCKNRPLGVPGEEKYYGRGLSFCAVCDGAFYKGKRVAVIGGGDTALDDAMYLSDICEKVYLVHRREFFRGSASTLEKLKQKENVEIIVNVRVEEITGDKKIDGIILDNKTKLNISGLFAAGGGMIVVPAFVHIFKLDEAEARATSVFSILPMVITSGLFYYNNNYINWNIGIKCAIGGIIGGFIGSKLLKKLPDKVLKIIFIVFLIYVSIKMII